MAMVTVQRQRQDEGCADRRKVGIDVADCDLATMEVMGSSCCARATAMVVQIGRKVEKDVAVDRQR